MKCVHFSPIPTDSPTVWTPPGADPQLRTSPTKTALRAQAGDKSQLVLGTASVGPAVNWGSHSALRSLDDSLERLTELRKTLNWYRFISKDPIREQPNGRDAQGRVCGKECVPPSQDLDTVTNLPEPPPFRGFYGGSIT